MHIDTRMVNYPVLPCFGCNSVDYERNIYILVQKDTYLKALFLTCLYKPNMSPLFKLVEYPRDIRKHV